MLYVIKLLYMTGMWLWTWHVYLFSRKDFSTKLTFFCNFQRKKKEHLKFTLSYYWRKFLCRKVCTSSIYFFQYVIAVLWDLGVISSLWIACLSSVCVFARARVFGWVNYYYLNFYWKIEILQFFSRIIISVVFYVYMAYFDKRIPENIW